MVIGQCGVTPVQLRDASANEKITISHSWDRGLWNIYNMYVTCSLHGVGKLGSKVTVF